MMLFGKSLTHGRRPILPAVTLMIVGFMALGQSAAALAQGYATDDPNLRTGMTAALSDGATPGDPKVERATQSKSDKIIGVTTPPGGQLVTVVSGAGNIYVQTSGEVEALTSDINGSIKSGDMLVISPLRGVLMRADDDSATVVGIALEDLDVAAAEKVAIEQDDGPREVNVGQISINLDHKAKSNQQVDTTDTSLSRLGRVVTGRSVPEVRVLASLVIFLLVLVVEGGIIYGAVSSAIISLGRNPMARKIISREVVRVIIVALMVFGLGLAAIYAVLWI